MEGSIVKDEPGAEFLPAGRFGGSKAGYVFKKGAQGLGYYLDHNELAPGTGGGYAASPAAGLGRMDKSRNGGIRVKVEAVGGGSAASSGQSVCFHCSACGSCM